MNATVEQISDKIKFLPQEFLDRIMGYIDALEEDKDNFEIPEWQKSIVAERIAYYRKNPQSAIDMEDVFKEIEKEFE